MKKIALIGSGDFAISVVEIINENVLYEIVGYINESTPIMGTAKNSKMNDKDFTKKYGDTTTFSYGCQPGQNEMYVYRMTYTSPDGNVIEWVSMSLVSRM